MMRQLYKRTPGGIRYWEAWEGDGAIIVHRGNLGDPGVTESIVIGRGQTPAAMLDRESSKARTEGYKLIRPPRRSNLVVQFIVEETEWPDLLKKMGRLWEKVSRVLTVTANGSALGDYLCDDGRMARIYASVIDPPIAMKTVVRALKKVRLAHGVVIASRQGEEWAVLWPEGFQGKFSIC